jgi:hypothetical protein
VVHLAHFEGLGYDSSSVKHRAAFPPTSILLTSQEATCRTFFDIGASSSTAAMRIYLQKACLNCISGVMQLPCREVNGHTLS